MNQPSALKTLLLAMLLVMVLALPAMANTGTISGVAYVDINLDSQPGANERLVDNVEVALYQVEGDSSKLPPPSPGLTAPTSSARRQGTIISPPPSPKAWCLAPMMPLAAPCCPHPAEAAKPPPSAWKGDRCRRTSAPPPKAPTSAWWPLGMRT